jgi:uncharacterized protein (TIGR00369 family)
MSTDAATPEQDIPEGFVPLATTSPYLMLSGPLYQKPAADGSVILGVRIERKHTNMRGITHGGMLVTLADSALGRNLGLSRTPHQPMVSVSLSTDFLGSAHPGDWLEAHVQVRKHGSRLSFAECFLTVGDKPIVRTSGVFAVVSPVAGKAAAAGVTEVPEG